MIDPHSLTWLSAALFCLGTLGVFVRRTVISALLGLQFMFSAAVLALVSFDHALLVAGDAPDPGAGQGFALLILTLVIAQAIVGFGLLIAARRNRGAVDPEHTGAAQW